MRAAYIVIYPLMLALVACGSEDDLRVGNDLDDGGNCLTCEVEAPDRRGIDADASPLVIADPPELAFVGSDADAQGLQPQIVRIYNRTSKLVSILDREISPVESISGQDGHQYFSVLGMRRADLQPGESLQFSVSFAQSLEQRNAELVVWTSHPDFVDLRVSLIGKIYVGLAE